MSYQIGLSLVWLVVAVTSLATELKDGDALAKCVQIVYLASIVFNTAFIVAHLNM